MPVLYDVHGVPVHLFLLYCVLVITFFLAGLARLLVYLPIKYVLRWLVCSSIGKGHYMHACMVLRLYHTTPVSIYSDSSLESTVAYGTGRLGRPALRPFVV